MGYMILGALCTAGEVFLIYFLVQLVRDSRRESQQLRAAAGQGSRTRQFARFEVAPPAAKAVWREGKWERVDSGFAASAPARGSYWKAAHRA